MGVKPHTKADIYADHPWRAPGTTPVLSPCGVIAPKGIGRKDGRDLPAVSKPTQWSAGSDVEVAFSITANHGGGYTYRLCPAENGVQLTEECFQKNVLAFVGNKQWVQLGANQTSRVEIDAVRLGNGTFPVGSVWTRNPIPNSPWMYPPAAPWAWGHQTLPVNVFDKVHVPSSLVPGKYVLSWRWDCEQTKQVWQNCGDIIITAPSSVPRVAEPEATPTWNGLPKATLEWSWDKAEAAISSKPGIRGDVIYIGTLLSTGSATPGKNTSFIAFNKATGHVDWEFPVPTAVTSAAVLGDGVNGIDDVVYFGTVGPWVYAVNATTGTQVWRFENATDDLWASPVLHKDRLLIGSFDEYFYCLDAATGEIVWKYWVGGQSGYSSADVSFTHDIVVFSTRYDLLYALDISTGELLWSFHSGYVFSSPTVDDNSSSVLVGTSANSFNCYDLLSGELKWQFNTTGAVWALNGALVDDGVVYFGSDSSLFHALDVASGQQLWSFQTGGPVQGEAAIDKTKKLIYFASFDSNVYALDIQSGSPVWYYPTGRFIQTAPAVDTASGEVYIGSFDHDFYALKFSS